MNHSGAIQEIRWIVSGWPENGDPDEMAEALVAVRNVIAEVRESNVILNNKVKNHIRAGGRVFLHGRAYEVRQNTANPDDFLIICASNGYTIGLHGSSAVDYEPNYHRSDLSFEEGE